jgi:hypothetical protein
LEVAVQVTVVNDYKPEIKEKGKARPITGPEGPEGEKRYSFAHS